MAHHVCPSQNPGVKNDCSGIKVGNSYCVEVNFGLPRPTTATSATATSTTRTTSTTSGPITGKPSPTQPGLIESCTTFYKAVPGDGCWAIVNTVFHNQFTLEDFYAWNPAVGTDCAGLQANVYYCVGIPGSTTTRTSQPSTTTTRATTTTSTHTGPSPTQPGLISTCTSFYKVIPGDGCWDIVNNKYGGVFTLAQFYSWNPALNGDCSGLQAGYYVCVGIPGTATPCTVPHPNPTQPGSVCGCKAWHTVVTGDTCQTIARKYSITDANFQAWNPQVGGAACGGLWAGYNVCVRN